MLRHHLFSGTAALLLMATGAALAGVAGFVLGAAIYFGLAFAIATWGRTLLLRWLEARSVAAWLPASKYQRLLDTAAERVGVDAPELFVTEGPQVNAFAIATGRSTAVCVTRGFLEILTDEQASAAFALQAARIRTGVARDASHAALLAGSLSYVASLGRPALYEFDRNPVGLPTVTLAVPIGAILARVLVSPRGEEEAARLASEGLARPEALGEVMRRAEMMSCLRPLRRPAALASVAMVSPHLGAPEGSLARLHSPRISVTARLESMVVRGTDSGHTDFGYSRAA